MGAVAVSLALVATGACGGSDADPAGVARADVPAAPVTDPGTDPGTGPAADPSTAPAGAEPVADNRGPDADAWTLMFYAVADNNTDGAMAQEIRNMMEAGFGDDVNMYVLIDRSPVDHSADFPGWPETFMDGDLGGLGDFSTAKVFHVEGDRLVEDLDLGEIDSSDPDTLAWFVAEVMRIAPADRTGLFLADHGQGAYGFGWDEDTGVGESSFNGQSIAQGIAAGLAPSGRRLDLVGFTACLMANYETAKWLAPHADYLVASEDLMPFTGLQYDQLAALVDDPGLAGDGVALELLNAYSEYHAGEQFAQSSISVTDLRRFDTLQASIGSLARALTDAGDIIGFQRAVRDSADAAPLDLDVGLLDLGDLARRLAQPGNPDNVRIAADAVFRAVDEIVLESWGAAARSTVTGLSISVPTSTFFDPPTYAVLGDPEWAKWLDLVVAQESGSGTVSADSAWTADLPDLEEFGPEGIVVSAQLADPSTVIAVRGIFGVPNSNDQMEVTLTGPAVENSGSAGRVAASWNYSIFSLSAGDETVFPTVHITPSDTMVLAEIYGAYSWQGTTENAAFVANLDPDTGEVGTPVLYVQGFDGAWAQAAPQADSTFTPLVLVVGQDGSQVAQLPARSIPLAGPATIEVLNARQGAVVSAGLLAVLSDQSLSPIWGSIERP